MFYYIVIFTLCSVVFQENYTSVREQNSIIIILFVRKLLQQVDDYEQLTRNAILRVLMLCFVTFSRHKGTARHEHIVVSLLLHWCNESPPKFWYLRRPEPVAGIEMKFLTQRIPSIQRQNQRENEYPPAKQWSSSGSLQWSTSKSIRSYTL